MQKLTRRLSLVMVALMIAFTALSNVPAKAATVVPQVQFAADQKTEFTAGERITFNLNAANYGGRVQYRVVLWNDATKSYSDLWNTADRYYANWQPYGNETLPLGWVINEPGSYRITVYVKRAGLANNKTALPAANCDSYQAGPAFTVKPAFVATALEAYEKAPLTTLEEVIAAEALKAAAADSVAKVTDATLKATLEARVAAADKKIADAREKLAYVHVEGVKALTATTIKVTFDKDVAASTLNFDVTEKDDAYAVNLIEKVAVSKNVATVTLLDSLSTKTNYVLSVKEVKSADGKLAQKEAATKEFVYVAVEPAKIVFTATTLEDGDTLGYKIVDAEGNDITSDFETLPTVESSDASVIDPDTRLAGLLGGKTSYSVVNLILDDYDLETGNTIITVVDTQLVLASLGRSTVVTTVDGETTGTFAKPLNYVFLSDDSSKLNVEVLDQNGDSDTLDPDGITTTYKSLNPTVALVDNVTGEIKPLSVGTVSVLVTVKSGDLTVRKTVTVSVKADPKATSIKLSATSAKLVRDSAINAEIDVTILDQYGEVFKVTPAAAADGATPTYYYSIDKGGIATGLAAGAKEELSVVDGKDTVVLTPYESTADGSIKSTAKLTIACGSLKAYVSLSVVDPAKFAAYTAVMSGTKIDLNQTLETYTDGDKELTVTVYEKDINGNYISVIDPSRVSIEPADSKEYIEITKDEESNITTITGSDVGTQNVIVKVEGSKIGTFAITVVDTAPVVTTVTQTKSAVQVSLGSTAKATTLLQEALFGLDADGKAFVGYDQYGDKMQIALTDIEAIAADNTAVVTYDVEDGIVTELKEGVEGSATLTMKIAGKFYTISVKVVK